VRYKLQVWNRVLFDLDIDESLGGDVFSVDGPRHALVGGDLVSADCEICKIGINTFKATFNSAKVISRIVIVNILFNNFKFCL
jgi:hypothetical protein